jgi:nodulation protein E
MSMRRVAVTGLGCVSGLGQGVKPTWDRLAAGEGAVRPLVRPLRPGEEKHIIDGVAAFVDTVDGAALETQLGRRVLAPLDPVSVYAAIATHEALNDAGLMDQPDLLAGAAVLYGSASGGNQTIEEAYIRVFIKGATSIHPLSIPKYMGSASVSQLSMIFGIKGLAFATSSACASSAHAIGEAMHMIRAGRSRIVVTGGSDASLSYGSWLGWKALQAMSPEACRPFSVGRNGMVLGEGAATLVLEDMDHALARGATIYAEVAGMGASSDASDLTRPDGVGAATAMRLAHEDAGAALDAPALISTHGTGTPLNDKMEAVAIREIYGEALARHSVIATKSAHGHLLGGAGAIEFLVGILALREGVAPPVLGYLGPDPECGDLPLAVGAAQPFAADHLVSNSFAFGGLNSVLIAKKV